MDIFDDYSSSYTMHGNNKLHDACREVSISKVKSLLSLKNGFDVHAINNEGYTPLHIAAASGSLEIVRCLVESGAVVGARQSRYEMTALDHAAQNGSYSVAEYLIQHGAEVNTSDAAEWRPIHRACQGANLDMVKLLIKKGAQVQVRDSLGYTPLHRACMGSGPLELIRWLLEHCKDNKEVLINDTIAPASLLHVTCGRGNLDVVKYLIEYGADIWARTDHGKTLLHNACESGSLETVKFLLGLGLDVNACDNNGKTPLYVACTQNHDVIFKHLVKAGADITIADKDNVTFLHIASERGNRNIVECLLVKGADVKARAKGGYTPLHLACREDFPEVISSLLEYSAGVNETTERGSTPLHQACEWGSVAAARCLLQRGANPNLTSQRCRLPFQLCSQGMLQRISIELVFAGVDLQALAEDLTINKYTAMQYLVYAWGGMPVKTSHAYKTLEFMDPKDDAEEMIEILFALKPLDLYQESLKDSKPAYVKSSGDISLPTLKALCRAKIRQTLGTKYSILPQGKHLITTYLPPSLINYVFLRTEAILVIKDRETDIKNFFLNNMQF